MKHKWLYFLVSLLVIVPGLVSLVFFGLKPSIDFTGGTIWEIQVISDKSEGISGEIQKVFEEKGFSAEVQSSGERRFLIKTIPLDISQRQIFAASLGEKLGDFTEVRFETVGPRLGKELLLKALLAVALAIITLLFYIAYRFRNIKFGAAAILAVLHDSLVVFGVFSLLGYFFGVEVDTLFVTAVLTTLSFSVHDTIVVFDRIREIQRKTEAVELEPVINQAVAETLVRSLNNSLTIIFMLTALFILGGETLRWFVFALLVGTITGTYSSTFTAAPLLLLLPRVPAVLNLVRGKKVEVNQ